MVKKINCRLKRNKKLSSCKKSPGGKLKCWKVDRKGVSWEEKKPSRKGFDSRGNKFGRLAVYTFKGPDGWVVRNTKTFKNPIISPSFKTKLQATKFARSYMAKHDKC